MPLTSRILGLCLLSALAAAATCPLHAGKTQPHVGSKQPLAPEDLYRLEGPGPLVLSADGQRAAYARHWINPVTKREHSSVWLVDGQATRRRPMEAGEPDGRAPVFS